MAQRSTNTLIELLQRWSSDAGAAMLTLPEQDAATLAQLLATFRQILSDQAAAAVQAQQRGMGAPNAVPGVMPGPGMPPSGDELARQLAMARGG